MKNIFVTRLTLGPIL